MPKQRDEHLLIEDSLENIEAVCEFESGRELEEIINDKMRLYAIIRALEIVGEAAKSVSKETKEKYPLIEWREMSDFRNRLIHHYFGIDFDILEKVIKKELSKSYQLLQKVELRP